MSSSLIYILCKPHSFFYRNPVDEWDPAASRSQSTPPRTKKQQEKPTVESRSNSSVREKNPDEELMDFVVLPEDLAQEGEEGMEGDTEIPFIPSWCGHPEKVRQKISSKKNI